MHLSNAMVCADLMERSRAGGMQEVHNKDLILHEEMRKVKEATSGSFFCVSF